MGTAHHTLSTLPVCAKRNAQGNKATPCRIIVTRRELNGFPADWKIVELIISTPASGKPIAMILKATKPIDVTLSVAENNCNNGTAKISNTTVHMPINTSAEMMPTR